MLKRLLCIIMPYIPVPTMLSKARLFFKRQSLQKHWVATMYELIKPELHADLLKLVGKKPDLIPYAQELLKSRYTVELTQQLIMKPSQFIDLVVEDLD